MYNEIWRIPVNTRIITLGLCPKESRKGQVNAAALEPALASFHGSATFCLPASSSSSLLWKHLWWSRIKVISSFQLFATTEDFTEIW